MTLFQLLALIGLILLVAFGRLAVNSFRNGRSKLSELRAALALARGNTDTLRAELLERAAEHSKLYARSRELARELSLAHNATNLAEERRASADDTALELSGRVRELQSRVDTLRNEANNASAAHKREIECAVKDVDRMCGEIAVKNAKINRLLKDVEEFTRADLRSRNEIERLAAVSAELRSDLEAQTKDTVNEAALLEEERKLRRHYAEELERVENELKATQASLQNKRTMLEKIRNAGELHTEGKSFELFDVDQQIGDELAKARSERDELKKELEGHGGLRAKLVAGRLAERMIREEADKAHDEAKSLREERDVLVTAKNDLESELITAKAWTAHVETLRRRITNLEDVENAPIGSRFMAVLPKVKNPRRFRGITVTPAGARRRGAGVAPKARKGGRS